MKKLLLSLLPLLLACGNVDNENEIQIPEPNPFEKIQLIGHMGDCGNAPENTMPSFVYAVDSLGLQWVECDPNVTKDGQIVLNHMQTIDSHSNGSGKIV